MMRFVPPAGSPLTMTQILGGVRLALATNGTAEEQLDATAERLEVKHIFGMCSGRAALWLALRSLQQVNPSRDVVAIPAYTCFSVAAAIVRAGLKIFPIEIEPHTLDFDQQALCAVPAEKLLCIIPCSLFGFPSDLCAVQKAARVKGAYVIDDAAQALGSRRDGKFAGAMGDIGIYSLGRGKSTGSVAGGLLVTDSDEIAQAIQTEQRDVEGSGTAEGGKLLLKMMSYSLLLHPRRFWIPNSLPFLKLGTTEFNPCFKVQGLHPLSAALLAPLVKDLESINRVRRSNAEAIRNGLQGKDEFALPSPAGNSEPTFVRFPVIARDAITRDRAIARLRSVGIGATRFYPSAICDIPGIERHMSTQEFHRARAEDLSRRLLTLPVHPFVEPQDIERIVEVMRAI